MPREVAIGRATYAHVSASASDLRPRTTNRRPSGSPPANAEVTSGVRVPVLGELRRPDSRGDLRHRSPLHTSTYHESQSRPGSSRSASVPNFESRPREVASVDERRRVETVPRVARLEQEQDLVDAPNPRPIKGFDRHSPSGIRISDGPSSIGCYGLPAISRTPSGQRSTLATSSNQRASTSQRGGTGPNDPVRMRKDTVWQK